MKKVKNLTHVLYRIIMVIQNSRSLFIYMFTHTVLQSGNTNQLLSQFYSDLNWLVFKNDFYWGYVYNSKLNTNVLYFELVLITECTCVLTACVCLLYILMEMFMLFAYRSIPQALQRWCTSIEQHAASATAQSKGKLPFDWWKWVAEAWRHQNCCTSSTMSTPSSLSRPVQKWRADSVAVSSRPGFKRPAISLGLWPRTALFKRYPSFCSSPNWTCWWRSPSGSTLKRCCPSLKATRRKWKTFRSISSTCSGPSVALVRSIIISWRVRTWVVCKRCLWRSNVTSETVFWGNCFLSKRNFIWKRKKKKKKKKSNLKQKWLPLFWNKTKNTLVCLCVK